MGELAPVYITFDLDSLDPADAPGVSNIEPGYPGIRIGEAVRMLQGLRGAKRSRRRRRLPDA
ncbi:arginase family protein [Pseudaminobacter soli (ex Li et al. 2025)]|uniref:arginase family protein n=1 Tax=Pseudaminobacter soli (ex Li et al. 2025) TaxID=1295366 RepID=UPI002475D6DF|nr:arginase family protein [Mesorhizobium soli]